MCSNPRNTLWYTLLAIATLSDPLYPPSQHSLIHSTRHHNTLWSTLLAITTLSDPLYSPSQHSLIHSTRHRNTLWSTLLAITTLSDTLYPPSQHFLIHSTRRPSNNHTFMPSIGSLCVGSFYLFIFVSHNRSPEKWHFPALKRLLHPEFWT